MIRALAVVLLLAATPATAATDAEIDRSFDQIDRNLEEIDRLLEEWQRNNATIQRDLDQMHEDLDAINRALTTPAPSDLVDRCGCRDIMLPSVLRVRKCIWARRRAGEC